MRAATVVVERAAYVCLHERILRRVDRDEIREHTTCCHKRTSSATPIGRLVDPLNHLSGFIRDKYTNYPKLKFYYTNLERCLQILTLTGAVRHIHLHLFLLNCLNVLLTFNC